MKCSSEIYSDFTKWESSMKLKTETKYVHGFSYSKKWQILKRFTRQYFIKHKFFFLKCEGREIEVI